MAIRLIPLPSLSACSPEAAIRALEEKIHGLLEESVFSLEKKKPQKALEKAKEAAQFERQLSKQKESAGGPEAINYELTYAVSTADRTVIFCFPFILRFLPSCPLRPKCILPFQVHVNLANVYQACEMYTEATNTITALVKNKTFDRAGRLRVNIGNINFVQGKYLQAVKQYRMALDQIPATQQIIRCAHCSVPLLFQASCNDARAHGLCTTY